MNAFIARSLTRGGTRALVVLSAFILAACAAGPVSPEGSTAVRGKLTALQNDPQLSSHARADIREAEKAVRLAEEPLPASEAALGAHRVYMANHQVEIARARAATKRAEEQRTRLEEERSDARLQARTREADRAHADARRARSSEADMQQRLDEMEARETERGMVVTLSDVLFDTGNAQLSGNASGSLDQLVSFLQQYPNRHVLIEGHTDNVGSAAYNRGLSRQRAESVKRFLEQSGIDSQRLSASGRGLEHPVASNDSEAGRQQNRRVEFVIIENRDQ